MLQKTLNTLEFNKILELLSEHAASGTSKAAILSLHPSNDAKEVGLYQKQTQEAYDIYYKYTLSPIVEFDDIEQILKKAVASAMLSAGELLKVGRVIRSSRIAKSEISSTGNDIVELKKFTDNIYPNTLLENEITNAIASEIDIKDDASDALRTIRRKIAVTNNKLKDKLNSYTRTSNLSKYLQDNIVTVRSGRFVIPVKSECRGQIPGLIHDQSSSGATVFIEPFPIVDLNNELKSLQLDEIREIEKILSDLSDKVKSCADMLGMSLHTIVMLDIVFAKMKFSVSFNGESPELNTKGYLNLINAKHPLINKEKVVPVSVLCGKDYKILIITGPNTGGKTVCLKTAGLVCLMAYIGLWIPCSQNSAVPIFDEIYCDIGDEQSISNSLSTFSAHMKNLVSITDNLVPNSLVLFDELGAGTDPAEGAALSIGIVKYLELINCAGIITTHYSELKEYALISSKLYNACMQFDEKSLKPTYKIIMGLPGTSNALKIAGTLGINDYILKNAADSLKSEKIQFENVLKQAESVKSEALEEFEKLRQERAQIELEMKKMTETNKKLEEKLEKITANAKLETKRIINDNVFKAEELIEQMKELIGKANEKSIFDARQLKKQIENLEFAENDSSEYDALPAFNLEKCTKGSKVFILTLKNYGTILEINEKRKEAFIQIGNLKTTVKFSDLKMAAAENKFLATSKNKSIDIKISKVIDKASTISEEIKVLGHTVYEAIEIIEPYLTMPTPSSILRIVHGKGTGALGKGIQSYLKGFLSVLSYRYGRYGEGDNGVTIVEFK